MLTRHFLLSKLWTNWELTQETRIKIKVSWQLNIKMQLGSEFSFSPHPVNLGTHTWWEAWRAQVSLTHHWEGGESPRETKWAWSVLVQKNNTDWQIAACLHLTRQGNPPAFSGSRHRRKGKSFYDIFERVNGSKIWLAKKMGGGSS